MALPANVKYESELKLKAYRIERDGGSLALKPFMSSKSWHNFTKLGYSVHLIDQVSGNSVAGADEAESRHHDWRPALYDSNTNYSQLIQVDIPQDAPTNRAFWVVLTLWRERNRGYYRQKVLESDRRLLDDTQVVLEKWSCGPLRSIRQLSRLRHLTAVTLSRKSTCRNMPKLARR